MPHSQETPHLPDTLVVVVLQDVTPFLPVSFNSRFARGGDEVLNHLRGCPLSRQKGTVFV